MSSVLLQRVRQKYRTMAYPDGPPPVLPDRWLGLPIVPECIPDGVKQVACPTGALALSEMPTLDMGRCIFCGACGSVGVQFSREYALARFGRDDLVLSPVPRTSATPERLIRIRSLFSKSLKLREISAGGCNACEADCNVLGTPAWDMSRFGISFVASPRHADGVLDSMLPVDLYIPGCPPHPLVILEGLLRFLGRVKESIL